MTVSALFGSPFAALCTAALRRTGYCIIGKMASRSDIFSELWKEYAHSDSRYLIADPLLLMLESATVVGKPLR